MFIADSVPLPNATEQGRRFLVHTALRLSCNHEGYEALWRDQLGDNWREPKPRFMWPVLEVERDRWQVRAAIDAVVGSLYGLNREQYAHVLSTFNHKHFTHAPQICLHCFDELTRLGLDAFTRKYDPYWDIPLNEGLPSPVIDFPITVVTEDAAQHALVFGGIASPDERDSSRLYNNIRNLLESRHNITCIDAQETCGCTAVQARTVLKRLVDQRIAVQEGRGRATRYVAVTKAEAAHGNSAGGTD